ncbi:MAG: ammonia-forming cytochrome c nitrite reductase subunit c552 [Chloroflexi bacterium]|nr:ammonia-forming cytochrome c nitrite reductase subunit c552 [Chloroflexota bacterium]
MQRNAVWGVLICGLSLTLFGVWFSFIAVPIPVQAQSDLSDAEYEGADECGSCHRNVVREHGETLHALALQEVGRDDSIILGDFEQGEEERTVQFPEEDAPRAFTADDIAYVIGAGRYAQRYVFEIERRQYAVFPAEWDTVAQTWRRIELDTEWPGPGYDFLQNCAGCHTTGLEIDRERWVDDGVWCEACHGPASLHIEVARDAGRRPSDEDIAEIHGAIVVSPDAQICAQCHSRGTDPESGRMFPMGYRPGTDLLHDSLFVLAEEDDPVAFWATGHARQNNMQFNEWFNSAHASALDTLKASNRAEAECLTCHSGDFTFTSRVLEAYDEEVLTGVPPELPTLDTAQFGITCTVCHSGHPDDDVEFNLADEPYALCTACHQSTPLFDTLHHPVKEMFEGQTIIDSVEGIPAVHHAEEGGPTCTTCHMSRVMAGLTELANHTWNPVLPEDIEGEAPPASCEACHTDLTTDDLVSLVRDTQQSVTGRLSLARARASAVSFAESDAEAAARYAQVVAALDFIQGDGSQGVHNYAYADALLDQAEGLLSELSVPGASLAPTEAPAPTATPANPESITVALEREARTGVRPITIAILGTFGVVVLAGGAYIFRPRRRRTQDGEE